MPPSLSYLGSPSPNFAELLVRIYSLALAICAPPQQQEGVKTQTVSAIWTFSVLHQFYLFLLGSFTKVAGSSDGDFLFLACAFSASTNAKKASNINIEGHFNLRHTSWCGWNAIESKPS